MSNEPAKPGHSPLPWQRAERDPCLVVDPDGKLVAHVYDLEPAVWENNRALILTACNHFGPLLEACKRLAFEGVGFIRCGVCGGRDAATDTVKHTLGCPIPALKAAIKAAEAGA